MSRRHVPDFLALPRSEVWLWLACCEGREPAECLDTRDREDLVASLVERGWTDVQVAAHTRLSTYTAARIRERIGLPPAGRPRVGGLAGSAPGRTTSPERPPTAAPQKGHRAA